MFSYISGELAEKGQDRIIVEARSGVAYEVFIAQSERNSFPETSQQVKIHTHLHVREDALKLYGFYNRSTRNFFRQLLPQKGVGPKLAMSILSDLGPEAFRKAVHNQDTDKLKEVSGVGNKTAKRLIVEMSEKLPAPSDGSASGDADPQGALFNEALEALLGLGFQKNQASSAVREALELMNDQEQEYDLETLISQSLQNLDDS